MYVAFPHTMFLRQYTQRAEEEERNLMIRAARKRYVKKNIQMYVKENAEIEVKSRNLADIAFHFS